MPDLICVIARVGIATLGLMLGGCGQQATIVLRDGSSVRARIVEKRNGALVAENRDSSRIEIREESVREIRHPGLAAVVLSPILVGAGTFFVVHGATSECHDFMCGDNAFWVSHGGAAALSGLVLGLYGLAIHIESKARAAGPRAPEAEPARTPAPPPCDDGPPSTDFRHIQFRGLRVTGQF